MNAALAKLLEERGDISFPHAPDTAETLLQLFRMGQDGHAMASENLLALVRSDAGFAFNLLRLLREDGVVLDSRSSLRAAIERYNALRAVAVLAPKETWAEVFGAHTPLQAAYGEICRRAAKAAEEAGKSWTNENEREAAALLALGSFFDLLALANLVPDRALPILKAGAHANPVCEESLGFSLSEFANALNQRYAVPDLSDTSYPAVLRDIVRKACISLVKAKSGSRKHSAGKAA
jgi:hypothetical protein